MKVVSCILMLTLTISLSAFSATVDTVSVYSNGMRKPIKCVVIKPDSYNDKTSKFPSIYLLHGHSGNYSNWIKRVPQLKKHVDAYQLIIICPDGAYNSWYLDSPMDSSIRYETAISKEIPAYIDANYKTIKDRRARAITGLSMGGHGGLFLGFRHANFFGACGSMSGALVIDLITKGYNMQRLLGDTIKNKKLYHDYSIMKEMESYPKDSLAIIIDCGTEDRILEMSRMAHKKMLSLNIPHDYTERPGKHDWNYWSTAIEYQLLFYRNYFDKSLSELN